MPATPSLGLSGQTGRPGGGEQTPVPAPDPLQRRHYGRDLNYDRPQYLV